MPYASLNLGITTADDPRHVAANRARLAAELGVGFAFARQVHGAAVAVARSAAATGEALVEADAVATAVPGVGALVLVADCVPVAVAGGGAVAMVHAGWGGLAAGVIAETVRAMLDLTGGGSAARLAAAIGPGAGPCCYEVGDELREWFAGYGREIRRGPNIDLKLIARRQLETAGVAQVHDAELCTICSPELFFSHRRDRGVTGRQAGVAWLT